MCANDVSAALGYYRNLFSPNVDISRLLLLAGASPDFLTSYLHEAPLICFYAYHGNTEMVSLLLQFGAQVDNTNSLGESALVMSATNGKLECARLLVENDDSGN